MKTEWFPGTREVHASHNQTLNFLLFSPRRRCAAQFLNSSFACFNNQALRYGKTFRFNFIGLGMSGTETEWGIKNLISVELYVVANLEKLFTEECGEIMLFECIQGLPIVRIQLSYEDLNLFPCSNLFSIDVNSEALSSRRETRKIPRKSRRRNFRFSDKEDINWMFIFPRNGASRNLKFIL